MQGTLKDRLAQVQSVLDRESQAWGRRPRLIAVTKYSTPEEILPLLPLGVADIGENRVQAIREKLPYLEGKFSIHLIGRLQTNKVKYIIKDVCMIHSLDHEALAQEIDRQAQKANTRMPVLVQVNIAREPQKGGVEEENLLPFIRGCARLPQTETSLLLTIEPIFNPIPVWLVTGERPGPLALVGFAVVIAGVTAHTLCSAERFSSKRKEKR